MKYREVPTMCIHGCGRPRRKGQRDCAECHAQKMREYRARERTASAQARIERTLLQVSGRKKAADDFRTKIAALAAQVAAQIKEFNGPKEATR
jgi:hypothetical protein